ncbi:aldose epimerase family protein [Sediminitomix flava]|nr:aldose epimerase family protein [Sediminitomix flava]
MKRATWLNPEHFKTEVNGKKTLLHFLKNENGMKVAITNYGARIVGLQVPDKRGIETDVVLGFASIQDYLNTKQKYFGASIGRYANRIAEGQFELEGQSYQLPINNGKNSIHGGLKGFHDVVWEINEKSSNHIKLNYTEKHLAEGFPGNLTVEITYTLNSNNELSIVYKASTDKATPINFTNHSFFNLNGEGSGDVLKHQLQLNAKEFTPINENQIPLGYQLKVENTAFDFRSFHAIGQRIDDENIQLKYGNGYDHNFVVSSDDKNTITKVASIVGDQSGIQMDVFSDLPGVQFYTANFLKSYNTLKSGKTDDRRTAFCLETQHFPDAINQKNFYHKILEPNDDYHSQTVYKFSW